jgi:hypothetical protein
VLLTDNQEAIMYTFLDFIDAALLGVSELLGGGTPEGQKGYEGQPGNQGNGLKGYEGQPGNQGGH